MIDGSLGLKMKQFAHEDFSREAKVEAGSDRSFGIVMAVAFSVVTLLNARHSGRLWLWTGRLAASFLAASFLAAGLLRPSVLNPLKQLRLKSWLLLHRVVNPIVMALLFYGTVLPTGLLMRMLGKDLLQLKRQPGAESYWIVRQPPGPSP
jgi:hypothetical protein